MSYYVGLLSGTSVDGIDAALVKIIDNEITLISTHEQPFSVDLKKQVQNLIQTQQTTLANYANCDVLLAQEFSIAVNTLLTQSKVKASDVTAIGSHGQTVYHQPNKHKDNKRSTIQIGSPHVIAVKTGINVVANFRQIDVALDGQGAPLAPIIHNELYASDFKNTAVVNLGGIANISFLGPDYPQVIGYDTGPANCLLDEWISKHCQKKYDKAGQWAQQGKPNDALLKSMLSDGYFALSAPKSTGREYFNAKWLDKFIQQNNNVSVVDVQNTLTHLTAFSIAQEINNQKIKIGQVWVMGGGAFNSYLINVLQSYTEVPVDVAENANWIEAILFAYLASCRVKNQKVNLSTITGSNRAALIGDIIKIA